MAHENLRRFLRDVPLLGQIIEAALDESPPEGTNSEAIRKAHEAACRTAFQLVRESGLPYAIRTYPHVVSRCPRCQVEVRGAYWELNHPSGQGATFPAVAHHAFIAHGLLQVQAPLTDLAGTLVGEQTLVFDLEALRRVLSALPLPPEFEAEFSTTPGGAA